jgi:hypothetical protein
MKKTTWLLALSFCPLAGCSGGTSATADGGTPQHADGGASVAHDGGTSRESGARTPEAGAVDARAATHDAGTATGTTAGVECSYGYSGFNDSPSVEKTSTATWSCTSTLRSLTANGIPDHATGTFPNTNCPNTIATQTVSASMTLDPVNTGTSSAINIVGYAFNGVKFDPSTAGTCASSDAGGACTLIGNDGTWNIEALGQSSFNFGVDSNNAHVQPTGAYHYHGIPEGVLTKLNKGMTPTLVGYALDGFPVYARYGYSSPMDATSSVVVMKGSYKTKTTPDPGRPSTATYPLGAFTQDYEYVAGSGDLDDCNGRTDVTPEFPNGIYHYYITDTYPFIQRCVKGTAMGGSEGGGMPGDGGMMGPPPKLDGGPPPGH